MTDLRMPTNQPAGPPPAPYGQPPQGFGPGQPMMPPMNPAEAAAYAKAAKAHAKSLRPWFKKKRFIAPIALVALFGIGKVAGGSDPAPTAAPSSVSAADQGAAPAKDTGAKDTAAKAEPAAEPEAAGIVGLGTAVTSGDFSVTITKVKAGVKSVGTDIVGEKAQGQFVLVSLKATNQGDDAAYLSGSNVKLLDADGREFSVNEMASIYVSDNNPLLEEINPGNTTKGTFVFDMPKGVEPVKAEISGGLFDAAAEVDLTN